MDRFREPLRETDAGAAPPETAHLPLDELLTGLPAEGEQEFPATDWARAVRWMLDRGLLELEVEPVPAESPGRNPPHPAANPKVLAILLPPTADGEEPTKLRNTVRLTGVMWAILASDARQGEGPQPTERKTLPAAGLPPPEPTPDAIRRATSRIGDWLTARSVGSARGVLRVPSANC